MTPAILTIVPDLPADNALPRWLEMVAGLPVDELPDRVRLGMDIDSPLDLELLRRDSRCPPALADLARSMSHRLARAAETLDALVGIARDPRRELLVSGRLSAAALQDLEQRTACRGAGVGRGAWPEGIGTISRRGHGRRSAAAAARLRSRHRAGTRGTEGDRHGGRPARGRRDHRQRASSWRIATAPTRRHGRARRTALPPTSCSPIASAITGSSS